MNNSNINKKFWTDLLKGEEGESPSIRVFRSLLGILIVLFVVAAFTGIIRYYFGVSLASTLPMAIGGAVFLYMLELFTSRKRRNTKFTSNSPSEKYLLKSTLIFVGVLGSLGLFLYLRMWNPYFHGLPVIGFTGGGDSGAHVEIANKFYNFEPKIYEGQNSFYALTNLLGAKIGSGFFASYRTATYFLWILYLAAFIFPVLPTLSKFAGKKTEILFYICATFITFICTDFCVFPLLHYLQADGFYSAIAGLAALMVGIVACSTAPNLFLKIVWLGVFTVVIRHSYVLNLGEYLIAGSLLMFSEAKKCGFVLKTLVRALGVALACAAVAIYISLLPVLSIDGGFDHWSIPVGLMYEIAVIISAFLAINFTKNHVAPSTRSFLVFCRNFLIIGLIAQIFHLVSGMKPIYYFYKHGYGLFLVSAACLVASAIAAMATWWEQLAASFSKIIQSAQGSLTFEFSKIPKLNISRRAIAIFAVTLALFISLASNSYKSYIKRDNLIKDWGSNLVLLADVGSLRLIEQTLSEKKAKFGGYLHSSPVLWRFTVASFGDTMLSGFDEGHVVQLPGFCVFWSEAAYVREAFSNLDEVHAVMSEKLNLYASLFNNPQKTCKIPQVLIPPEYKEKLCSLCY